MLQLNASRLIWLNVLLIAVLIAVFGRSLYSLSIDLTIHEMLVDHFIHKNPDSSHLGVMAGYPQIAYRVAAYLAGLTGSGITAMLSLNVASTFVCFLALAWLCSVNRSACAIALAMLALLALPSKAIFGFETVDNFSYPQLLASAGYMACIFLLVRYRESPAALRCALSFVGVGLIFSVHGVPALHLAGTFALLLTFEIVMKWSEVGRFNLKLVGLLVAFSVLTCAMLYVHPAMKFMRTVSVNNGGLDFGLPMTWIFCLSTIIALVFFIGLILGKIVQKVRVEYADLALASMLFVALGLTATQYAALEIFGEGSEYAVKNMGSFCFPCRWLLSQE